MPMPVARLEQWVAHYFGDTAPGAATKRFHAAIARLMESWEAWHRQTLEDDDDEDAEPEEAELDD